jgi:mRNA-degrading endonuclease RelE of RelBE toxin-antitoxin system
VVKRSLEMGARANQSFYDLERELQRRVFEKLQWFLENDVAPEPLEGNLKGLYKLRVGD